MKKARIGLVSALVAVAGSSFAGTIVVEPVADFISYFDGGSGDRSYTHDCGATLDTVWSESTARADAHKMRPRVADVFISQLNQHHDVNFTWRCQWLPSYPGEVPAPIYYTLEAEWRGSYDIGVHGLVSGSGSAYADSGIGAYWFPGGTGQISTTAVPGMGSANVGDDSGGMVVLSPLVTVGVVFDQKPDGRWLGTATMLYGGSSLITGTASLSTAPAPVSGEATTTQVHKLEAEVFDVSGPNLVSWTHGSVAPY